VRAIWFAPLFCFGEVKPGVPGFLRRTNLGAPRAVFARGVFDVDFAPPARGLLPRTRYFSR
jgi:hypothetical protein